MKAFEAHCLNSHYLSDWIYLGTVGGNDYYLEGLPTDDNPFPSYSIVYGNEPEDYISTTISVAEILDDQILSSKAHLFTQYKETGYMLHLVAFIRDYFTNHKN